LEQRRKGKLKVNGYGGWHKKTLIIKTGLNLLESPLLILGAFFISLIETQ